MSFRSSITHETYTITNNKIVLCIFNYEEVIDEDEITTYPLGSNIPLIEYFDVTDIPNSIEELKKIYKMINFDYVTAENRKEHNPN